MTPMYTNLAPCPERASTSFTLSWGLLNIPLSVYSGTEEVRVARKEFVASTGDPVGRVSINKTTGDVIDRSDVVKMAESTSGAWVELDDDEIAQATQPRGLAVIEKFVPVKSLGNYLTEGLMQVRPKRVKGKTDPSGAKALVLLLEGMKARKVAAVVKIALRGPARYALIDHEGFLRFVVTADAIRRPIDLPVAVVSKQEKDLALMLIDTVGIESNPTFVDDTAATVQAFVDAKAGGATPIKSATPTPTVDLYQALMDSIKKDVAS